MLLSMVLFQAGATPTPGAPGVSWLNIFAQNLSNLTTVQGGVLTSLGLTLLSFIAFMMLCQMVITINTSTWTFGFLAHPVDIGVVMHFMLRLGFCAILEHYWINPLPGASFGFNHLFSYLSESLVKVFDSNSQNALETLMRQTQQQMEQPGITAPLQMLCYMLVQIILGVASGILFLINISSFILYGVSALFGPVFIPLYMTNSLRGKFFHYFDVLLGFAMIRAVAAAFVFVWSGFMTTFIQQTFNGVYTMDAWEANLVPVVTMFVAFILNMLYIPSLTNTIFGGTAGFAGRAEAVGGSLLKLVNK